MEQSKSTGKERTLQVVLMGLMVALIFIFSRFLGINTDVIHLGLDFLQAGQLGLGLRYGIRIFHDITT